MVWLVGTVAAIHSLPSLSSQVDDNNGAFLPASAPSNQAAVLAEPLIGSQTQSQVPIVAVTSSPALAAADRSAVNGLVARLHHVPSVLSAHYLTTSPDGRAAELLVVSSVSPFDQGESKTLVTTSPPTVAGAGLPADLEVHLAGQVATNVASQEQSAKQGGEIQDASLLFIIVLLFLIFRSVLAPIVTLVAAALVLGLSGSFIGALGSAGTLKVSFFTQILLIVLVLGAGTDYGLFLVFRVREQLLGGSEPRDAVVYAVRRVGESITASAATVMVALLTLLAASFGLYHDLGLPLAIGIAVMLLAGLTLLPALLAILGRAVFWPTRTRTRDRAGGRDLGQGGRPTGAPAGVDVDGRGARPGGPLAVRPGLQADGVRRGRVGPGGQQRRQGQRRPDGLLPPVERQSDQRGHVLSHLGLGRSRPAADGRRRAAGRALLLHRHRPSRPQRQPADPGRAVVAPRSRPPLRLGPGAGHQGTGASIGVGDPRRRLPRLPDHRPLHQRRRPHRAVGGGVAGRDAGSTASIDDVPGMRALIARVARDAGADRSGLAGEAPALYDVSHISDSDVGKIVPIAILAIGLVLALVLRSLVAPLYLILSVVLSYLASLGIAVLVFMVIGGQEGIIFLLPFLMFIFLLALGRTTTSGS